MINLQRFLNPIDQEYMRKMYSAQVNLDNIDTLSYFKLKRIFKGEEAELVNKFLHNIIHRWVEANYKNDELSYGKLKKLIKRTHIQLNEIEAHDLLLLEERAFSLFRHIKILEVDVELAPGETCGAKFLNSTLNEKHKLLKQLTKGDLLITNRRLIIKDDQTTYSFYYSQMKNKTFENYGFEFKHQHKKYVVRIHDQVTLNNTLNNVFSRL